MASKYLKSSEYFTVLGKLFGISQFSLIGDGHDFIDVLHCVPFLAIYTYLAVQSYKEIWETSDNISMSALWLLLAELILGLYLKVVFYFIQRKSFKQAFYKIDKLNDFLKLRHDHYTQDNLRVLVVFSVGVLFNVYLELFAQQSLSFIIVHQLNVCMNYLEVTFMYKMLNELSKQCESINERLQKRISFLALDRIQPKSKIWNELLDVKKLRESEKDSFFDNAFEMAEAHLAIGQIAKHVNSVFGVTVLLGVLSDFTTLTMSTVAFCEEIRMLLDIGKTDLGVMLKAFNCLFLNVLIMLKQCYSIYYWTKLKKTLKATVTCLHKMWNTLAKHNEIDEKSNYLQLLIVQLFNGMPNFSAYGVITIDWPLIILIISSAATYVVIIMQFKLATQDQKTT